MGFQYDHKKIEYKVRNFYERKVVLINDKKRITQILFNLLSNSFKFTRKGFVELRIEEVEKGFKKDNKTIQFIVKDTEIGMNKNQLKHILTAFYTSNDQNINP